jgi:hypothetical protein
MTRENQDIEIYQADDFRRTFIVYDENGNRKDISGASADWAVAREAGETPVLDDSDVGVDLQISNPGDGEVLLTVEGTATQDLDGDYIHELELTSAIGNVVTVSRGLFAVDPDTA